MDKEWKIIFAIATGMAFFLGSLVDTPSYAAYFNAHETITAGILAFIGAAIGGIAIYIQFSRSEKRRVFEHSDKQRYIGTMLLIEIDGNSNRLYQVHNGIKIDGSGNQTYHFKSEHYELLKEELGVFPSKVIYFIFQFYEMKQHVDIILRRVLDEVNLTPAHKMTNEQVVLMQQASSLTLRCLGQAEICHHLLAEITQLPQLARINTKGGIAYDDGR